MNSKKIRPNFHKQATINENYKYAQLIFLEQHSTSTFIVSAHSPARITNEFLKSQKEIFLKKYFVLVKKHFARQLV